jgi:uncharacterized protein
MFVGTARFVIHIPAAQSLKDRRRVVNKLKDRIRARLSVSLCEIGDAERHQVATIAIATVARDAVSCQRVIDAVRAMAETLSDAWLTDTRSEVLSFGADGGNLRCGIESDLRDDSFDAAGATAGDETKAPSMATRKHRRKERE